MTQARRARAHHPMVWVVCTVLGLALVACGVALAVDRTTPADTRHAVPTVDFGSVPSSGTHSVARTSSTHHAAPRIAAPHHSIPVGSSLQLARFGITAPISRVQAVGGVMQVPLDPHRVGWWTSGAAPGDAHGTTVIVGHINYAGVDGALSVLPQLRAGDVVTITEPTGRARFRVVAVHTYAKSSGIPQSVFTTTGAPRLALITCGGPFDSATGNYEDNIVAYAVPTP